MSDWEFCELWWAGGYRPQLTFYKPLGAESVPVGSEGDEIDPWDSLHTIITELSLNGWELMSAAHHGGALFFKRHLQ